MFFLLWRPSPNKPASMTAASTAELSIPLPDEAATERLGARLGALLEPGDFIALTGDLGAGKTALARATVRARLGDPDDPFDDTWDDRGLELLDVQRFDRIAGPTGLDRPDQVVRRADCPVAPELLRID